MAEQLCEYCGDRPGTMNSHYWTMNGSYDGHWVCNQCELEFEKRSNDWNCPCGCDGPDDDNCVYRSASGNQRKPEEERPWFSVLTKEQKEKGLEDMVRKLIDAYGWEYAENLFVNQLGFTLAKEQETDEFIKRTYIKPGNGSEIIFAYGKGPSEDLPQGNEETDDDQHP